MGNRVTLQACGLSVVVLGMIKEKSQNNNCRYDLEQNRAGTCVLLLIAAKEQRWPNTPSYSLSFISAVNLMVTFLDVLLTRKRTGCSERFTETVNIWDEFSLQPFEKPTFPVITHNEKLGLLAESWPHGV